MTENEKQLLLIDLCARFPYGVICKVVANDNPWIGDCKLRSYWLDKVTDTCYEVKPYLRPVSSMTEEEVNECYWLQQGAIHIDFDENGDVYEKSIDPVYFELLIDFYHSHHLDYRGFIDKGLALEAPEDMYKTE